MLAGSEKLCWKYRQLNVGLVLIKSLSFQPCPKCHKPIKNIVVPNILCLNANILFHFKTIRLKLLTQACFIIFFPFIWSKYEISYSRFL